MFVQSQAVYIAILVTILIGVLIHAFPRNGSRSPKTTHPAVFAFIVILPVLGLVNCLRTSLANERKTPLCPCPNCLH